MLLQYLRFNTSAELFCLVTAIICLRNDKSWLWRCMIPYLLLICMAEFTGVYLKKQHQSNQWVYNVLLLFQIGFTHTMFGSLFSRYTKNKLPVMLGFGLLSVMYLYEVISNGFFKFNMLTYNTMSVIYVLYALYYFYLLLKDDEYIDLKYSANFWWVAGILFFYFGSTAVNLFRGHTTGMISGHSLSYYIYIVLNLLFYGCWAYAFICKKWLTKTYTA